MRGVRCVSLCVCIFVHQQYTYTYLYIIHVCVYTLSLSLSLSLSLTHTHTHTHTQELPHDPATLRSCVINAFDENSTAVLTGGGGGGYKSSEAYKVNTAFFLAGHPCETTNWISSSSLLCSYISGSGASGASRQTNALRIEFSTHAKPFVYGLPRDSANLPTNFAMLTRLSGVHPPPHVACMHHETELLCPRTLLCSPVCLFDKLSFKCMYPPPHMTCMYPPPHVSVCLTGSASSPQTTHRMQCILLLI